MIKNTGSQNIGAQMTTAADGTIFAGAVTVYVTGDAGTQALGSVGSGVCTSEGNGYYTYAPAQAETNYALIAFTFIGTGAISATVQVFTQIAQQTGDNFARIGAGGVSLGDLGGMSTAMKAEVNAECGTALTVYDGPTNTEMIARTRPTADYFDQTTDEVTTDAASRTASKADVSGLATPTNITAGTITTCTNNTDMRGTDGANTVVPDVAGTAPTSPEIVTAMEADGGDLSSLMEALVNKRIWKEDDGDLEMFNDAGVSQGTVSDQVTSDGFFTTAKRAFI